MYCTYSFLPEIANSCYKHVQHNKYSTYNVNSRVYVNFACIFVSDAKKQLTLFGTIAKAQPLIKDDKKRDNTTYQQVVNKFWTLNSHGEISKQVGQEPAIACGRA